MSKKIFAILLLLGMSLSLVWAGGIAVNSTGARAVGLGTAFRGVADDWSTLYWNPAGMAQIGRQAGLNASFVVPNTAVTPALFEGRAYAGFATKKTDAEIATFIIPALGYSHPINKKLSVGLGVFAPFGLGTAWNLYNLPPGYNSTPSASSPYQKSGGFPELDFESLISVIVIQPTVSYKLNENWMFGLGIGITVNEINLKQAQVADSPIKGTPLTSAPNDQFSAHIAFQNGKGISWALNAGALYKMNDQWTFGTSIRYYADMELEGDATLNVWLPNDTTTRATINGAFSSGSIDAATQAALIPIYSGGIAEEKSSGTGTIPLPISIGLGAGYRPNALWLFTSEVEWTQWSVWDKIPLKFDTQGTFLTDTELIEEWSDGVKWAIAAEYLALNNEKMKLFLRGAYEFDQSPIPDKSLTATISEINNHNSVFLGATLHKGPYMVDLNLENIFFADRDVKDWTDENVAGKYEQNVFAFHISLGYKFK